METPGHPTEDGELVTAGDERGVAWPAGTRFVERATFRDGDEPAEWYVLQLPPGAPLPAGADELRGYEPGGFRPEKLVVVILALAAVAYWHLAHAFAAWEAAPFVVLAAVLAFLYVPESAGYDETEAVRLVRAPALPDEVRIGAVQRIGLWRAERDVAVTMLAPGLWWLLGAVAGPFGATTGVLGAAVLVYGGAEMLRRRGDGDGEDDELASWTARNVVRAAPRVVSQVSAFVAYACALNLLFEAWLGGSSPLERALMGVVAAVAVFQQELRGSGDDHPETPRVPTRPWLGGTGRALAGVAGIVSAAIGLAVADPLASTAVRVAGVVLLVLAVVCFILAVTGGGRVPVNEAADRLPPRGPAGELGDPLASPGGPADPASA